MTCTPLPTTTASTGVKCRSAVALFVALGFTAAPVAMPTDVHAAREAHIEAEQKAVSVAHHDLVAIQQVIREQMAAFSADDAQAAFKYATPMVQKRFGNADKFFAMVKTGYAPLYRARMVSFHLAKPDRGNEDAIIQSVIIQGPTGLLVNALYRMVRMDGGEWRIAGCVLRQSEEMAL